MRSEGHNLSTKKMSLHFLYQLDKHDGSCSISSSTSLVDSFDARPWKNDVHRIEPALDLDLA